MTLRFPEWRLDAEAPSTPVYVHGISTEKPTAAPAWVLGPGAFA